MGYVLGLKVGIASVGFAGVESDKILFCGARAFAPAENPKDGSSFAEVRREARSTRRRLRRQRQRLKSLRGLCAEYGLCDEAELSRPVTHKEPSVWELRKVALERVLSGPELARVLYQIGKHRGADYRYNSAGAKPNEETQKTMMGARALEDAMLAAGCRTAGAYLAGLEKKRNDPGSYERFVTRDMLRSEVRAIFDVQRKLGSTVARASLEAVYAGSGAAEARHTVKGEGLAFYQEPLESVEKLVGMCPLEPGEKRAPKGSYTGELFVLWTKLNHCRIRVQNGADRTLMALEKERLAEAAHEKGALTFKQCRKLLKLGEKERFNISYFKTAADQESWEKIRDAAERKPFLEMKGYRALKEALAVSEDAWAELSGGDRLVLDAIAEVLAWQPDEQARRARLSKLLEGEQVERVVGLDGFKGVMSLSLSAMRNLVPLLEEGHSYGEAVRLCGYGEEDGDDKQGRLPPFEGISNPVVNRACREARRVLNAAIEEHGMPHTLRVELARDFDRSFEDRRKIAKAQAKQEAAHREAERLAESALGRPATGHEVLKYRLWQEQNGWCPYSGVEITAKMLGDGGATEVDYIRPFGRSLDGSMNNKVLCLSELAREKRGLTPFEAWGKTDRWPAIAGAGERLGGARGDLICAEVWDEGAAMGRALSDYRYIATAFRDHVAKHLQLAEGGQVEARKSVLRGRIVRSLGLESEEHHDRRAAVEAIVGAASSERYVSSFAHWDRAQAVEDKPGERPRPPAPWRGFEDDVRKAVGAVFVSRPVRRKITGQAHEKTVRRIRKGDGKIVQRIRLESLTYAHLETMVDRDRNKRLYELLKGRLAAFEGDGGKAFAEPIHMPSNDPGRKGPRIFGVRVETNHKSGVPIRHGQARNGDMIRVDVFEREKKFYLVPVYVHQFAGGPLPLKAISAGKIEEDWTEMKPEEFAVSLYPNDLVRVQPKTGDSFFGYYRSADRSTGAILVASPDGNPSFGSRNGQQTVGVRSLKGLEKWTVNCLGQADISKKAERT